MCHWHECYTKSKAKQNMVFGGIIYKPNDGDLNSTTCHHAVVLFVSEKQRLSHQTVLSSEAKAWLLRPNATQVCYWRL